MHVGRWERAAREEGSEKQLSESEPRVRTPVMLVLLCDLGQMSASMGLSLPFLEKILTSIISGAMSHL